jgi:hypothetical protein
MSKIVWYSRAAGIARMGPYPSQVKAIEATFVVKHAHGCKAPYWPFTDPCSEHCMTVPADGAFAWPEVVATKKKARKGKT